MISMCIGIPIIAGSLIGTILLESGIKATPEVQHILILLFSLISILPFIVSASIDLKQFK